MDEIIKWNAERGLLDTFDPDLEVKMLASEINEFVKAEGFAHKLQEFADIRFVYEGTKAKFRYALRTSLEQLKRDEDAMERISAWIEPQIDLFDQRLLVDLSFTSGNIPLPKSREDFFVPDNVRRRNILDDLEWFALEAVISANKAKPTTKDVDGKVIKGAEYQSPLDTIRAALVNGGVVDV